jgi:hypothetical protein
MHHQRHPYGIGKLLRLFNCREPYALCQMLCNSNFDALDDVPVFFDNSPAFFQVDVYVGANFRNADQARSAEVQKTEDVRFGFRILHIFPEHWEIGASRRACVTKQRDTGIYTYIISRKAQKAKIRIDMAMNIYQARRDNLAAEFESR